MMEAAKFLTSFAQAISTMALYRDGHPARERAVDSSYEALLRLREDGSSGTFTFLGGDVICGSLPVRELKGWDWATRLSQAGIQRLEFEQGVSREDFENFLDDVLVRLALTAIGTADARQMRSTRIRFGTVGLRGEAQVSDTETIERERTMESVVSLAEEAQTLQWLHDEVHAAHELHLPEAEAVVRSLAVTMHSERHIMLPLLRLKEFDEYTTTHAMNVSVLAMGLAEYIGLSPRDVRAFGVAGLLHDIGKVQIPREILTKPGKLTDAERQVMNAHTVEGARIIIETQDQLDLAAVVAYEHHIMIDGAGYPRRRWQRECHYASRIVHVCDVYDALRTDRPYREAWEPKRIVDYITEKAGTEFDAEIATQFTRMMSDWESRIASATWSDN